MYSSMHESVFEVYQKYYLPSSLSYEILLQHSVLVAAKAVKIAVRWNEKNSDSMVDVERIKIGALLHDIGICEVSFPEAGCSGPHEYLYHGVAGYYIVMKEWLGEYANFCLTHTGVGISHEEIVTRKLPLPLEFSYIPETLEEKIVSYADLFYSKCPDSVLYEKSVSDVENSLARFGDACVRIFRAWHQMFT